MDVTTFEVLTAVLMKIQSFYNVERQIVTDASEELAADQLFTSLKGITP
jgi:hypothetical protein